MSPPPTSGPMQELSRLLRLQKYHKRSRRELHHRLDNLKLASSIQAQLLRTHAGLRKSLADSIRTSDKSTFKLIYDHIDHLQTLSIALAHDQHIPRTPPNDTDASVGRCFLDQLSSQSRHDVSSLLTDLVFNDTFLIQRLLTLDQSQLEHLQNGLAHDQKDRSVFGHLSSPPKKLTTQSSRSPQTEDAIRGSPLAFLFGLIQLSSKAGHERTQRRPEQLWATVCATMLCETRPGREKFIISILDHTAHEIQQTAKTVLETWIKEVLRDGHFLINTTETLSFGNRSGDSDSETFYTQAIRKLFTLLKYNRENTIIPQPVLTMCQIIVEKLRTCETKFRSAPFFFLAHWLFSTFLPDLIITPESRGLMLDEFFPETARHKILREIIVRAQKIVIDISYSWNHAGTIDQSLRADVEAIAAHFRPLPDAYQSCDLDIDAGTGDDEFILRSIGASDIVALIHSLFPEKQTTCRTSSSRSSSVLDMHSSASSMTGLSFFRQLILDDDTYFKVPGTDSNLSDDSENWPLPQPATDEGTITGRFTNDDNCETSSMRIAALRLACTEIESTLTAIATTTVPQSESLALLVVRKQQVTICDGTHILAASQNESEILADGTTNDFRQDPITNDAYLQVRKALLRLMPDPLALDPEISLSTSKSNATMIASLKARASEIRISPSNQEGRRLQDQARDGLSISRQGDDALSPKSRIVGTHSKASNGKDAEVKSPISAIFEANIRRMQRSGDFTLALEYTRGLDKLEVISLAHPNSETELLECFIKDVERSMSRCRTTHSSMMRIVSQLEQQCYENESWMTRLASSASDTRAKMWYCSDVRTSAGYAELERLAGALRSMCQSSQRPTKKTEPPALRHKGTLKPKNMNAIKRGEASILNIMVTDPAHRVACKLKDDQVALTKLWMDRNSIENICSGEERLHRLLCEVSKCLTQLINADPMISPMLWGSELFRKDRLEGEDEAFHTERANEARSLSGTFSRPGSSGSDMTYDHNSNVYQPSEFSFMTSHSPAGSFDSRSSTLMTKSSTNFWSPSGMRSMSPLSNVSSPPRTWSPIYMRPAISRESFQFSPKVKDLLSQLRPRITGLLLSDVVQKIFFDGSETDLAFFRGIGRHISNRLSERDTKTGLSFRSRSEDRIGEKKLCVRQSQSKSLRSSSQADMNAPYTSSRQHQKATPAIFNMPEAKRQLVRKFELSTNPFTKLQVLHEIETVVLAMDSGCDVSPVVGACRLTDDTTPRVSTWKLKKETCNSSPRRRASKLTSHTVIGDKQTSVSAFESLFSDPSTRPAHLFRDLQTIASLVPAEALDSSPYGRSFWSATVAALSLKQVMTQELVESADLIISRHKASAGHDLLSALPSDPSRAPQSSTGSLDENNEHPLLQAFNLLHLAAAQSNPAAQRELATLYLTHPDLLPRVLAPFSKCAEVFRPTQESKWVREHSEGSPHDAETMCVAFHWMELSAAGGDALAKGLCEGRV